MVRGMSSVMGAQEQEQRLATWALGALSCSVGSYRGIRERQWPEQSCAFQQYLGVAMSRGSCSLACVTPGVTSHPPLLCSRKQILILLLPLPTSWPLGKSFYLRPSMVSPVKWRGVSITPPVGGGEGPDWL